MPAANADPAKLLTAYVSPASDVTVVGLDTDGGMIATTSNRPSGVVQFSAPLDAVFSLTDSPS